MWKDYSGNYEVSQDGQVRNKKTGRIMKPYLKHNGYLAIDLLIDGKKQKWRINRLVLVVWCPRDDMRSLESHHINHIRTDNRLCNLMWTTKQENLKFRDERKKQRGNESEQLWIMSF